MEKKISFKSLFYLLWLLLFIPAVMLGQVNVGSPKAPSPYAVLELSTSVVKGGVRMPQLTTAERNTISSNPGFLNDAQATGLTIYNVTSNCIEYWNNKKWISLCQGELDVTFNPSLDPTFPKEGGVNGPYTPIDNFPCAGKTPYTYTVITGGEYTGIEVQNADTGTFSVLMSPNTTATSRMAIVRVTNNCSTESKEFLFSQEGNTDLCGSFTSPTVFVSNGGVLCGGGAVYMQVTNANDAATYIWTINDIEQGRGAVFSAVRTGVYRVYIGAIGCAAASSPLIISSSGTTAPLNPISISASNNGIICSSSSVTLTAFNVPVAGTLTWYKNGVKSSKTGNPISLAAGDAGNWFAVVEEGSCTSVPSTAIAISVDNSSTPLAPPQVYINGKSLASVSSFCSNGQVEFVLNNYSSYTTGVTVKWYNGLTLLGEGEKLSVVTPSGGDFALRCVVSDNVGTFCSSELFETKALTGTSPAKPVIVSTPSLICGETNAQLAATVSGGSASDTYNWYKDGKLITGETTEKLTADQTGSYTVEVIGTGGCISELSNAIVVGLSDFPALKWGTTYDAAAPGQDKIYQVEGTFTPKVYNWTVDGGAVVQNGQGTNIVRIKFPDVSGPVNVTVTATNECGLSDALVQKVSVSPSCTPAVVRSMSMTPVSGSLVSGGSISMSVTANGSNPITYQWLRNGIAISGATTSTYTKNNVQDTDNGVYTCSVTNSCTPTPVIATAGTVTVINIATIVNGSGTLAGPTCFDVAVTESAQCGTLISRTSLKADFTKTQVYTFTNVGTGNNNLSFFVDDPQGTVVSTVVQSGIPTTLVNGGKYTITVKYKESLMTTAIPSPIQVRIIALYKNASAIQNKASLSVTIKDCQCCGAFVAAGEWKNFMCHNLGADYTLNPMVPTQAIAGNYYQYGRSAPVATSYTDPLLFISGVAGNTLPPTAVPWKVDTKVISDPCPEGYRVPVGRQLSYTGLWNATLNPRTYIGSWVSNATNFSAGVKFSNLMLPTNGMRSSTLNGRLTDRGVAGYYGAIGNNGNGDFPVVLGTHNDGSGGTNGAGNNYAISIRCIEE